jgi:hypothetical protein
MKRERETIEHMWNGCSEKEREGEKGDGNRKRKEGGDRKTY